MANEAWALASVVVVTILLILWCVRTLTPYSSGLLNLPSAGVPLDIHDIMTLFEQDVPRTSFVVIYELFPFDTSDARYLQIKSLENKYWACYRIFHDAFIKTPNFTSQMMDAMNEIEECMHTLDDLMMQYNSLRRVSFEEFRTCSSQVYDTFDEIRRMRQGQLKGYTFHS